MSEKVLKTLREKIGVFFMAVGMLLVFGIKDCIKIHEIVKKELEGG